jgi:hypothetical protein
MVPSLRYTYVYEFTGAQWKIIRHLVSYAQQALNDADLSLQSALKATAQDRVRPL